MILINRSKIPFVAGILLAAITTLLTGCGGREKDATVGEVKAADVSVKRFEQDLFSDSLLHGSRHAFLRKKYGSFYDIFVWQLTRLGDQDSIRIDENLQAFVSDTSFMAVYAATQSKYQDFTDYAIRLSAAFKRYEKAFPGKTIPQLLTTISVFSYPVICDSQHLAIGLDMYLNPGSRFYPTLEPPLPAYLMRRMRAEYIVSDGIKGWLQSDYAADEAQSDLLQMMVSAGRVQFCLKELLPEEADTLRSGFTEEQMIWCEENEGKVWSYFIESQLLYNKDMNTMMKYVGEGPTTSGFPKESPGNLGQFIGYKIVQAYMNNHPKFTLQELMGMTDLHRLFLESRYKPKR